MKVHGNRITSVAQVMDRVEIDPASGCWLWSGAKKRGANYGELYAGGKTHRAHRWFYEQIVGAVPHGMELDHLCRTPLCVNPNHLEPVTHRENQERAGQVLLNEDKVRRIRRRFADWSDTTAAFARHEADRLGVAPMTIEGVVRGHTWKHVDAEDVAA